MSGAGNVVTWDIRGNVGVPRWLLRGPSAVHSNGGKESLFQSFSEELKQRLCSRIVGQAEVRVDLGVGRLSGGKNCGGEARVLQHVAQTQRLCGRVGMAGNMQDQERRNALAF